MASHFLFISYRFPIEVLFMSYSILIHFLFISCSFSLLSSPKCFKTAIRKWNKEKKANAASDPIQNEYIFQYKIQYIIPNTFTNKESIALKDSLHNQLNLFISFPSIVYGGSVFLKSLRDTIGTRIANASRPACLDFRSLYVVPFQFWGSIRWKISIGEGWKKSDFASLASFW